MEKYLFRPDNCYFGDCMPFYNTKNGLFYLYFQKDTRNPIPFGEPFGWQLVTTKDFINYKSYGEVLKKGTEKDQDQFVYAGSVFLNKDNKITAYYTGYNRNWNNKDRPSQALMSATSDNGIKWTKKGIMNDLLPQKGFDSNNWRDPYIIWDEENKEYLLILGTRLQGNKKLKTGRIVYFVSNDCENWNFKGDFFAPNMYTMMEMPQLLKINQWWYLIYSEYDYKKTTHYCISKNLQGPWLIPENDTFNGRAYYAARSCSDGKHNYLFGWVPSKEAGKDINNYLWGGTLLPLEIIPDDNGILQTKLVDTIIDNAQPKLTINEQKITSISKRSEINISKNLPHNYLLSIDFMFMEKMGDLGLIFFENDETKEGYEFTISMSNQNISVSRTPNLRWFKMLNIGLVQNIILRTNNWYHLDLLIDDTIAVLNINGVVLSCRVEKTADSSLGIAVTNSSCLIK